MDISKKILNLRTDYKLTQSQLAKIAGVSDKAVSAWELGTRDPKIKPIQNICAYFGIDVNKFIDQNSDVYKNEKPTPVSESELDDEIVKLWTSLTPSESQRVMDFVQGLIAARKDPPSQSK